MDEIKNKIHEIDDMVSGITDIISDLKNDLEMEYEYDILFDTLFDYVNTINEDLDFIKSGLKITKK